MKKRVTRSIVPNLLTLVNLFAGFTAIVHTSNGAFEKAALFIFIASVFDMLDGITARLIKSTSELGVELDSLCDAVSFGVAPSYMLYKVYFYQLGEIGILISALPALAGVYRLARFNIQLTSFEDKKYYRGLPIPSSALIIISYIIFFHLSNLIPELMKPTVIISVTFATSLAMVSNIKYDNLPMPTKKSIKQRPIVFVFFIIGLIGSIITMGKFIFPFMVFYLITSAIRHFIMWIKETRGPEDELDETEELEPSLFD